MPQRSYNASGYRYGFNGKENDNEVKGEGNQLNYGARAYDPRVGRFLSMDPLHAIHADMTPYHNATNNPISRIDIDGNDDIHFHYLVRTVFVPNGRGGLTPQSKTFTWSTVVRNNLPNTFAVHRHNVTINQNGKRESTYTERVIPFYPDASLPKPRSGVTTSTFIGITRPDDDYTALLKTLEDFPEISSRYPPEIRNPNASKSQAERNADFMWGAMRDSKARAAKEHEQQQVNALMLGVITTAASEILLGKMLGAVGCGLSDDIARTFMGGKYTEWTLQQDITLFRVGESGKPLGQFFSLDAPQGVLQSRIDKAILPIWPNGSKSIINTAFEFRVPAGTRIYFGEVAPQGGIFLGGTNQVFIPKGTPGLKLIGSQPLK